MNINKSFIDSFIRSTERAAYGASLFKGKNDKIAADQAAVDEMRKVLNTINVESLWGVGKGFSSRLKRKKCLKNLPQPYVKYY